MQFLLALFALVAGAAAATSQVRYDNTYDDGSNSLDIVACSNGANGLETKYGWKKFSDIPSFPNIGAASAIAGWNSPSCGTCWNLTYNGVTIFVTGIDHAGTGFNIAETAMNTLTKGNAEQYGVVNAITSQVALSHCGIH